MDDDRKTINDLQRSNRLLMIGFWILAVLLLANMYLSFSARRPVDGPISTRQIEIVDETGEIRAEFGPLADYDDKIGLLIRDESGGDRIVISIDDGETFMYLLDENEEPTFIAPPELPDFELSMDYVVEIIKFISMFL